MANKKITELPAAATLTGTELVELVQGSNNVQATAQEIANLASGGGGSSLNTAYARVSSGGDLLLAFKVDSIDWSCSDAGVYQINITPGTFSNPSQLMVQVSAEFSSPIRVATYSIVDENTVVVFITYAGTDSPTDGYFSIFIVGPA